MHSAVRVLVSKSFTAAEALNARSTAGRLAAVQGLRAPASTVRRALDFSAGARLPRGRAGVQSYPASPLILPAAPFHTTSRLASGAKEGAKTVRHPEHPTGIYFHLLPDLSSASADWKDSQSAGEGERTSTWAISLLEKPPTNADAASIMGFVRIASDGVKGAAPSGHVESGEVAANAGDPAAYIQAHPDAFFPNPAFMELLHTTLRDECVEQDELLRFEAQTRESGWAHVNDQRELLMPGRQAWPENIIASVAFTDGVLRVRPERTADGQEKSTYQPNDAYRLVTAQDGFLQLKETWLEKVRKRCEASN